MAEITTQGNNRQGRRSLRNRNPIKIDFTPMVDLGFLLITFFMLTTTLSSKYALPLVAATEIGTSPLADTSALTVLLTADDKVHYYFGQRGDKLETTDFSSKGIRRVLMGRNKQVFEQVGELEEAYESGQITQEQYKARKLELGSDKYTLMVMIKSDEHSRYSNLIDLLDELQITRVQRYVVMDLEEEERVLMAGK